MGRRRPAGAGRAGRSRRDLQRGDVDGLRALVAGLGLVAHARALGQGPEALPADARVVDEEVLAGLVRRDEAEALVVVEPLDGSGGHSGFPPGISRCCDRGGLKEATTRNAGTALPGRIPDGTADRIPMQPVGVPADLTERRVV